MYWHQRPQPQQGSTHLPTWPVSQLDRTDGAQWSALCYLCMVARAQGTLGWGKFGLASPSGTHTTISFGCAAIFHLAIGTVFVVRPSIAGTPWTSNGMHSSCRHSWMSSANSQCLEACLESAQSSSAFIENSPGLWHEHQGESALSPCSTGSGETAQGRSSGGGIQCDSSTGPTAIPLSNLRNRLVRHGKR